MRRPRELRLHGGGDNRVEGFRLSQWGRSSRCSRFRRGPAADILRRATLAGRDEEVWVGIRKDALCSFGAPILVYLILESSQNGSCVESDR